jgi:hypothetical protein
VRPERAPDKRKSTGASLLTKLRQEIISAPHNARAVIPTSLARLLERLQRRN